MLHSAKFEGLAMIHLAKFEDEKLKKITKTKTKKCGHEKCKLQYNLKIYNDNIFVCIIIIYIYIYVRMVLDTIFVILLFFIYIVAVDFWMFPCIIGIEVDNIAK